MTIENTVSIDFWPAFVDYVIDCRLPCVSKSIDQGIGTSQVIFLVKWKLSWSEVHNRNPVIKVTVNVLKFQTLVACQKGLDKQCRPRSDCFLRVFPVCYSDKYLWIPALKTNNLFENRMRNIQNFKTFTVIQVFSAICASDSDRRGTLFRYHSYQQIYVIRIK